ncbi:unnamed protein product [Cylindrotheca closterium]|uniref:Transmembrane 9 superfamily member n=1 Tax=Cylindrotheca closterium TaxID=2856 RepID=A0AAD2G4Q2_9STRA|nr:unnamed protein product [Cylindrotheca closterium]
MQDEPSLLSPVSQDNRAYVTPLFLALPINSQHDGLLSTEFLKDSTLQKVREQLPLTPEEKKDIEYAELSEYKKFRSMGYDEVTNSLQAMLLRNYRLRKNKVKMTGLFRNKETNLSQILFPGSRPKIYHKDITMVPTGNLMKSRMNLAMYDISDHPAFANTKYAPCRPTVMGAKVEGYGSAFKEMPFNFMLKRTVQCAPIVTTEISPEDLSFLRQLVREKYRMYFQLDDLPVLMRSRELNVASKGVPIGFMASPEMNGLVGSTSHNGPRSNENKYYLYNHFKFTVTYHENPKEHDGVHITRFDIHPFSFKYDGKFPNCDEKPSENDPNTFLALEDIKSHKHQTVTFSYDVQWVRSEYLKWEDRWDVYFVGIPDSNFHYYSIINSAISVLILASIIAWKLYRTFRCDMVGGSKKNNGWKQLHADVFRLPPSPMILSVLVGDGVHLLVTAILTMVLNVLGWISTMETGDVVNAFVLIYALVGAIGGYTSTTVYKLCGGKNCRKNALVTSTLLSGLIVIAFCLFNQLSSMMGSSADWFSVVELVLLWGCVSVPLVQLGAKKGDQVACFIEFPTKPSGDVRPIPKSKWAKFKWLSPMLSGIMTFGVYFVELQFIMSAIWDRQTYLGLGYLLTQTFLAIITCAECCVCFCYLQLNAEDHQWWWPSFRSGAAVGVYLALYALMIWFDRLGLEGWYSFVSFLTCMLLASLCVGIAFGSIGFLSCLYFTRGMYGTMTSEI